MAEPTSMKPGTMTVVTLSTSSAQSGAFGTANPAQPGGYTVVRIAVTVDTWVKLDTNPTAVANADGNAFLPAGTVECWDVPFGYKIAGIAGGAGYMSLTTMSKS